MSFKNGNPGCNNCCGCSVSYSINVRDCSSGTSFYGGTTSGGTITIKDHSSGTVYASGPLASFNFAGSFTAPAAVTVDIVLSGFTLTLNGWTYTYPNATKTVTLNCGSNATQIFTIVTNIFSLSLCLPTTWSLSLSGPVSVSPSPSGTGATFSVRLPPGSYAGTLSSSSGRYASSSGTVTVSSSCNVGATSTLSVNPASGYGYICWVCYPVRFPVNLSWDGGGSGSIAAPGGSTTFNVTFPTPSSSAASNPTGQPPCCGTDTQTLPATFTLPGGCSGNVVGASLTMSFSGTAASFFGYTQICPDPTGASPTQTIGGGPATLPAGGPPFMTTVNTTGFGATGCTWGGIITVTES